MKKTIQIGIAFALLGHALTAYAGQPAQGGASPTDQTFLLALLCVSAGVVAVLYVLHAVLVRPLDRRMEWLRTWGTQARTAQPTEEAVALPKAEANRVIDDQALVNVRTSIAAQNVS